MMRQKGSGREKIEALNSSDESYDRPIRHIEIDDGET